MEKLIELMTYCEAHNIPPFKLEMKSVDRYGCSFTDLNDTQIDELLEHYKGKEVSQ